MNLDHLRDAYIQLGQDLSRRQEDQLATQLAVFRSALVNFACDHGEEIKHNSEFRTKFTQMCQLVGVDPLELQLHASRVNGGLQTKANVPSSIKTAAEENFRLALAVRVVEVCHQTRELNGGLISTKELISRLQESEIATSKLTNSDITAALAVLDTLGGGYETLSINGKTWLKFTNNVTNDHKRVYELCEFTGGYVTNRLLRDNFGWDPVRCKTVVEEMIMNGFLWVDQGETEWQYWEPSWISS